MRVNRPDEPSHEPLPRLPGELLGDLLANLHQFPTRFGIHFPFVRQVQNFVDTFKMIRNRHPPVRPGFPPHRGLDRNSRLWFLRRRALALLEHALQEKLTRMILLAPRSVQPPLEQRDLLTQFLYSPVLSLDLPDQFGNLIVLELQLSYGLRQCHTIHYVRGNTIIDRCAAFARRLS